MLDLLSAPGQRRYAVAAAVLFACISLPLALLGTGERSAYVLTFTTFPAGQAAFGLFGYNFGLGRQPVFAENSYYFDQTLMFGGAANRLNLYFTSVRPVYAFLASIFAPMFGVVGALALLNYLCWIAAAFAAWRFTWLRYRDPRAALLAVVLVSAGLGFAVHVHDYSPHILPFTVYYLTVLAVYESNVWREGRPWQTHLSIGAVLAIACLTYSMGMALVSAYILVSLRHNQWSRVATAAVIGVSAQYAWTTALNGLKVLISGVWTWTNVQGTEQLYMMYSLQRWYALLATPAQFFLRVWDGILQFSNFDFLPVVLIGVVCWLLQRRSITERWFDIAFVSQPIFAGLVYLNHSTTRGYLVYGVSLVLYAAIAGGIAAWLRARGRVLRILAALILTVVVVGQLTWSSGHLWGYVVPAKAFFGFGYREWIPLYLPQFRLPTAASLTDAEPTPVMFGGASTLEQAGMYVAQPPSVEQFSVRFALAARSLLAVYFGLLVLCVTRSRMRWLFVVAVAAVLWLLPSILPMVSAPSPAPLFATFSAITVPAGETRRLSLSIGDDFVRQLRQWATSATSAQFMVPALHPPFTARISVGDGRVVAETVEGGAVLPSSLGVAELVDILAQSRQIEVEIQAKSATNIFGWQRAGLRGRRLSNAAGSPVDTQTLPAFEMRLLDEFSRPVLIGF